MGKPRTSSIPIYDGDDFERITELHREAEVAGRKAVIAEADGTARAGDDFGVQEAKDAYDAFVLEAADRAEVWTVQPIGHAEFRALLKEHPPRKTTDGEGEEQVEEEDAAFGVNVETFGLALLTFVDPDDPEIRTVTSPELGEPGLRKRLKRLSVGEFDTLWIRAFQLNTGGVADPKASLYSDASRSTSAT